MNFKVFKFKKI